MAGQRIIALQVMLLMQAWSSTKNMVNPTPKIKLFSTCTQRPALHAPLLQNNSGWKN
jgi:hypothetical protein